MCVLMIRRCCCGDLPALACLTAPLSLRPLTPSPLAGPAVSSLPSALLEQFLLVMSHFTLPPAAGSLMCVNIGGGGETPH